LSNKSGQSTPRGSLRNSSKGLLAQNASWQAGASAAETSTRGLEQVQPAATDAQATEGKDRAPKEVFKVIPRKTTALHVGRMDSLDPTSPTLHRELRMVAVDDLEERKLQERTEEEKRQNRMLQKLDRREKRTSSRSDSARKRAAYA